MPPLSTFTSGRPIVPVSRALRGSVQLRALFSFSKMSKTNQRKGWGEVVERVRVVNQLAEAAWFISI